MTAKTYTWHKFADSIGELQLPTSGLAEVEIEGKKVCIILNKEHLYACTAKCPHAGGNMSEGHLDALGNIVCPIHRYRFSIERGRDTSGEGYFLKTYPVEIRPDGLYIGFDKPGIFNWLK